MATALATEEQQIMEDRYSIPYNWTLKPWSRRYRKKMGIWRSLQRASGNLLGKDVLDVGCGDGWHTAHMVRAGAKVSGIDFSERAIDFARHIVPATFKVSQSTSIPFPDESFDVVFCIQTLEHVPLREIDDFVDELFRVVRPGGEVILSVPSKLRPFSRAHFQHFTPESLVTTVRAEPRYMAGQERRTRILNFIERLIENRYYVLFKVSDHFNRWYYRLWNHTAAEKGQNIVAAFSKDRRGEFRKTSEMR